MSTIKTNAFGIQRKNKQNLKKFVSIIGDYEQSLNSKVDDLVSHIINYAKKVQDPLILPEIKQNKSATIRSKSQSRQMYSSKNQNSIISRRDRSISNSFSFMSQVGQNMEQKINNLKKTVASLNHENITVIPEGRAVGNKRIIKPRFAKRQADIIPRQIRLDPFSQKNIIKAQELDKGILSLIQKGKIGKDVDIITAFQKGGQILNTKQAIFHNGQERLTRIQPLKPNRNQQTQLKEYSNHLNKVPKLDYQDNSWAITMPDNQIDMRYNVNKSLQQQQKLQLDYKSIKYLKFLHYSPVQNSDLNRFKVQNQFQQSQINSIFYDLKNVLQKYSLQIAYIDSSKVLELTTLTKKLSTSQLLKCILNFKQQSRVPLKQIVNIKEKKDEAVTKIQSTLKMSKQRGQFLHYLERKKVEKKISSWLYKMSIMKSFKQKIEIYREEVSSKFQRLQREFRQNFYSIQKQRHYVIHISNKSMEGKGCYKQFLNTQITRIFNFQNPNTYIIIVLSEALAEQTKNYYYKIMELEEIPNFRQRVTFLNIKQYSQFSSRKFTCSQKLYYDSKLIRQIKRRVGNSPAFFRISYPSVTDVLMSSYFQIPIMTGNLLKLLEIQQRSQSIEHFGVSQLKTFKVHPDQMKPLSLFTGLVEFCQNNKKYKNYVVKVNGCYQSTGIGLLTYPFDSLPGMYSNTAFIINSQNTTPSQFYRKLCKKGGIIQVFQQSLNSILVMGKINAEGQSQLTATFDKISYGFVNVGYFFPQMTVENNQILPFFNSVSQKLADIGHFGDFQLSLFVDQSYNIYFDKIQCYQTQVGSSLFYFKFLCQGNLNNKGQYITKITETFQTQDNKQEEVVTLEPRSYCFIPYILHFGLSQKQVGAFFQLCRMGGISFDLQNKFGSTFILLGSLKNSMGMITTARDRQTCKKLMLKSLDFIMKQNSHNNSKQFMQQKQKRMRQRQNIIALKQRLQDL